MWDHLGLLDLLDRRWVFPHMKHPVPTEQVGSATPEISLTIRTHCSTPLLHNIATQTSCQRRFLYNFTPWGIITTHYDQSVIWPPVCFERPQCVLKSEDWSENCYVLLWQVNCKQTQTEKLHVSVWRWVVAPVSSVQYSQPYLKTTSGCKSGNNWKIALKHAKWQGLRLYIILTHRRCTRIDTPSY